MERKIKSKDPEIKKELIINDKQNHSCGVNI